MKKITSLFTGLVAAATLFGAVGCTNQVDYIAENTVRNAFTINGICVEGLDSGLNGAAVELMVRTSDVYADGKIAKASYSKYGEDAIIADKFTDEVSFQSGSAYKAFTTNNTYDGDELAANYYKDNSEEDNFVAFPASKFQCFIKVAGVEFKELSSEGESVDAVLSVPVPSKVGDELNGCWLKVVVNGNSATYSFVKDIDAPVNVTLTRLNIHVANMSLDAVNAKAGLSIETSALPADRKIGKYTLNVIGLDKSNIGLEVQLAGASISPDATQTYYDSDSGTFKTPEVDEYKHGDWWYGGPTDIVKPASDQEDTPLHQKIVAMTDAPTYGQVSWSFYGSAPTTFTPPVSGPAIKIYKFGKENKDKVYFLLDTAAGGNFQFPEASFGKDVVLTIDVRLLTKGKDYTIADPITPKSEISIKAIKVKNVPDFAAAGYIAFTGSWLEGKPTGKGTPYKVLSTDGKVAADGSLYMITTQNYLPGTETFVLATSVYNPVSDSEFATGKFVDQKYDKTPELTTSEYISGDWILVIDRSDKNAVTAGAATTVCYLTPAALDPYYESMK